MPSDFAPAKGALGDVYRQVACVCLLAFALALRHGIAELVRGRADRQRRKVRRPALLLPAAIVQANNDLFDARRPRRRSWCGICTAGWGRWCREPLRVGTWCLALTVPRRRAPHAIAMLPAQVRP